MQAVRTIGLDVAKSVFQVHGVDAARNVLLRRQIKRRYALALFQKLPPCVVGIEAVPETRQCEPSFKINY
jgi:transposase